MSIIWMLMVFACSVGSVTSQTTDCMSDVTLHRHCIRPNSTTNLPCSGRGECICGMCECFARRSGSSQKYSGRYCQCDDYSCNYHYGRICGGNGRCHCGVCDCDPEFVGQACECPTSADTCIASNGKICNGVGECICGVCRCDSRSSYRGPTCEECPTCPGKCTENKNCVMCVAFHTGPYDKETCERECQHVKSVHQLDTDSGTSTLCQFVDPEDDCRFSFSYEYVERNEISVSVQTTKVCPDSDTPGVGTKANNTATAAGYSLVGVLLGVVGGVVVPRIPT